VIDEVVRAHTIRSGRVGHSKVEFLARKAIRIDPSDAATVHNHLHCQQSDKMARTLMLAGSAQLLDKKLHWVIEQRQLVQELTLFQ
jgi:hypothetical protein